MRGDLNLYIFTPEAAFAKLIEVGILFLVFYFFIKYWQESQVFSIKEMVKIFGKKSLDARIVRKISK